LISLALARAEKLEPSGSIGVWLTELLYRKAIAPDEYEVLRKLYDLRNEAAMASLDYSVDAAVDYVVAALTLADELSGDKES